MADYERSKVLKLKILEILTNYSDCDHRLRQADIISLLEKEYGIECERKTIGRNIQVLKDVGYEIVSDRSGSYLADRKFEAGELRLLIDSVLSNRNVCKSHAKGLIEKLTKEGGKYFKSYAKHVVNLDDWQKAENFDYFYNIELLCAAIEKKVKVKFFTNSYGLDKKLHPRKAEKSLVNPYQLLLKNGYYYLACNFDSHDNLAYCRVDRLTDITLTEEKIKPVSTVKGCEHGLNLGQRFNRLPYMYEDKPMRIEFQSTQKGENMMDNVMDWFGQDVVVRQLPDGNLKFSLTASPMAMRFWILQFGRYVKVLSPQSLVNQLKEDIVEMGKLYGLSCK